MKKPADLQIQIADLRQPEQAAAYHSMLAAYARDPMGGSQVFTASHLKQVSDDLMRMPHARCFLAYLQSHAVGFATCFTAYSTFSAAPLWNIHDLAVLPEYRHHGIASALLLKISEAAKQAGACKLTLEVREDNHEAASLYRKHDFTTAQINTANVQYLFLEKSLTS